MKHYYNENHVELPGLPDPWKGVSPMTDERFVEFGGIIEDDEEPTPQERVCESFAALIADLASKTDKITPEEFLAAAQNGISSDLIAFAREREVPEDVIAEGRSRIVEIMADALRYGMTWAELIQGVMPK
jgi:hypothetical protein